MRRASAIARTTGLGFLGWFGKRRGKRLSDFVVRVVEACTLELHGGSGDQLFNLAAALFAHRGMRVRKLHDALEAIATLLAVELVKRHSLLRQIPYKSTTWQRLGKEWRDEIREAPF